MLLLLLEFSLIVGFHINVQWSEHFCNETQSASTYGETKLRSDKLKGVSVMMYGFLTPLNLIN